MSVHSCPNCGAAMAGEAGPLETQLAQAREREATEKARAEQAEAEAKRRGDLLDIFCGLRIPELEAEVKRLRVAFIAAVRKPMGVVPDGYEDLYDAKEATDA